MKKRILATLLCAVMSLSLLAGCGGSTEQPTGDSGDGEESAASAKVAYLTPSLDVPFWRYVRYGIEDELGKSGIECVTYDSKDDANTQLSNAQDALTKQVDAIIISPTDSASCVSVLSAAEEAGVPVVICDIGTDSGEYVSYISTDNLAGGKAIGEYIASQLEHRTHSLADVAAGARRFVLGLGKKVLLANVFYELITTFKASGDRSVLFYWLYAAACVLNIYFDFSGYSDMAIGLGRIFGFHYLENFDYPYISASITEFWRRWHMSLGSWFRDYVYIPLGGNRRGKPITYKEKKT